MHDVTRDPALHTQALTLAQDFIHALEAKDLDALALTLHADARQLFLHSPRATTPEGVTDLIAGRGRGLCVADIKGRSEILAYSNGIFAKFDPLVWREHTWTVSPDGTEVFFQGRGDMVVARTNKPYRNSYVMRFDIADGRIATIAEYGNALLYAGLGVRPNGAEFRGLLRAVGRLFSPTLSSRSGR